MLSKSVPSWVFQLGRYTIAFTIVIVGITYRDNGMGPKTLLWGFSEGRELASRWSSMAACAVVAWIVIGVGSVIVLWFYFEVRCEF